MKQFEWEHVDEAHGVWTREYVFAPKSLARMMTARAKDGSLVAISPANGLGEKDFETLRADGGVSALIAPNGFHHLGLASWSQAFPNARIFAPAKASARVAKKQPKLRVIEPLEALAPLLADGVRVLDLPGISIGETWITVEAASGPIWYVADSCFSMETAPASLIPRLLFKWTDSAPGFKINGLGLAMFTKDKPALRKFMLDRLAEQAPSTVITAHGAVVREAGLRERMTGMVNARFG
jgi:hypothetical protein